jgi:hypothetical protein
LKPSFRRMRDKRSKSFEIRNPDTYGDPIRI